MRILFVMHYPGYLRYFDSTIVALAARGHDVHVGFESDRKQAEGLEALPADDPHIHRLDPLPARGDVWDGFARRLRWSVDYARYLHPRLADASYLRRRMGTVLPAPLRFLNRVDRLSPGGVDRLIALYRMLEDAVPPARRIVDYIRTVDPDVVLVSPLVTDASAQTDVVKAARALGIPVGLLVASWDHLTTKGLIRIVPDRVVVWNEFQREEAVTLHGVPEERVVVTGAQPFDRWFGRKVPLSRREFAAKIGLDRACDRPFVLFVGSTASISSPDAERRFVDSWLRALRASADPLLRDVPVIVRPHPYNLGDWSGVDLCGLGAVVWPRDGANPVNEADRDDYFLSLHHAAAVVGINTSAMVEAAIQGTPVLTVRAPEFRETQDLTVHFRYLLPENGGFVRAAGSLAEHLGQLRDILHRPEAAVAETQGFVASFVRPHGLETKATPRVADAIDELGELTVAPEGTALAVAFLRPPLLVAAAITTAAQPSLLRRRLRKRGKKLAKSLRVRARRFEKGSRRRQALERAAKAVAGPRRAERGRTEARG